MGTNAGSSEPRPGPAARSPVCARELPALVLGWVACGRRERASRTCDEHAGVQVQEALVRLGGIAERRALLGLCSRRALDAAVKKRVVVRLGRSRYALPAAGEARAAASRAGGVVSHLSAALAHGWKVKKPPAVPHVTVRRNRGRLVANCVTLHWAALTDAELVAGITDPVRTVVDCARVLPFDEALAVADSALRSGKVRRAELFDAARRSPRTGRAAALRVVAAASRKAANPFESVLRAIALGVPGLVVVPQGPVGAVGHADLTDAELRIAVEAESFEFHALAEAFRYDVRRYTAMTREGWLVARFVWEDVMRRPDYVEAVLVDLVALRAREQAVRPGSA
jgi:very-short-patch-repair endonuclease